MPQPLSPTSAFEFVRNAANRAVSAVHVPGAFDRIKQVINSLGDNFRSAAYGLREEVPFERWYYDNGFEKPLTDILTESKARFTALIAACEGVLRLAKEVGHLVLSLLRGGKDTHVHLDILKAQGNGIALSLLAIAYPNFAKSVAHNAGGSPLISWRWGTLYTGKADAALPHVRYDFVS